MKEEEKDIINPIDKDKITESPSNLPYAHTVGGAAIKPTREGVIRNQSMAAMQQQTDMQLQQISEQIELLARQARELQERKSLSAIIYNAKMGFKPDINHVYHLYRDVNNTYVLSMIGPDEWGKSMKYEEFIHSVRLLADHTWSIES